jgi:hypothetical protein
MTVHRVALADKKKRLVMVRVLDSLPNRMWLTLSR